MKEYRNPPDVHFCMTLLFVAALASPIYKVEIDAWASSAQ